jgi:hypothetical protein
MTPKEKTLQALEYARGDDFVRVRRSFAGLSKAEMQKPYGASGHSRQTILDGYEKHDKDIQAAIDWVNRAIHD